MHELLGDISKKYFGWNIRTEGVFTGSKKLALKFGQGNVYIFIPIGKYRYV
jgi:hypothetical protein